MNRTAGVVSACLAVLLGPWPIAAGVRQQGSPPSAVQLKRTVPGKGEQDVRVHDFRTPPGKDAGLINTDRDYRVLSRVPGTEQWLEVPWRQWEAFSHETFARLTHYDPAAARAMLPAAERPRWDRMTDAQRKAQWAEMHQQLATDKWHPEATLDFSDQARDYSGRLVMTDANIVKVRGGEGNLIDARRLGMMYNEKADVYLRQSNPLEAMAQLNKGIGLLYEVRALYTRRGYAIGQLSDRFQQGAAQIRSLSPYDHTITPARIADAERWLQELGFRGVRDFKEVLDSQLHALQLCDRRVAVPVPVR